MKEGRIIKVSGPLVVAEGMDNANVYDVVEVSENKLVGEIIEMRGDRAFLFILDVETTKSTSPESKSSVVLGDGSSSLFTISQETPCSLRYSPVFSVAVIV